jgi:hypothetical protein
MGTRPATAKQINFIKTLLAERPTADRSKLPHPDVMTTKDASNAIDWLMTLPKAEKAKATGPAITEAGMYMKDGVIYKVQKAVHGSGHLYAKKLAGGETEDFYFEYAPGVVKNLTPADKMTLEQAKEFGALYGTCCVCGRTLTDEDSIEAGIGPVCAKKF